MSGPKAEIFLQWTTENSGYIWFQPRRYTRPTTPEMLGLQLEGMGGTQSISTLVVAQNIASTLCLKITTALPITVCTSPLFEGTGGQARTSHFLSIHTLPSSMPSPTGDASQQSAGMQRSVSGLLPSCLLYPGFLHLWLLCTSETLKKKTLLFYFVCMNVWYACMNVYCVCTWYPQKPEEGVSSAVTGVMNGFESSCGCWELNLGTSERAANDLSH